MPFDTAGGQLSLYIFGTGRLRPFVSKVLGEKALGWYDHNYSKCVRAPASCLAAIGQRDAEYSDGFLVAELPAVLSKRWQRQVYLRFCCCF